MKAAPPSKVFGILTVFHLSPGEIPCQCFFHFGLAHVPKIGTFLFHSLYLEEQVEAQCSHSKIPIFKRAVILG